MMTVKHEFRPKQRVIMNQEKKADEVQPEVLLDNRDPFGVRSAILGGDSPSLDSEAAFLLGRFRSDGAGDGKASENHDGED